MVGPDTGFYFHAVNAVLFCNFIRNGFGGIVGVARHQFAFATFHACKQINQGVGQHFLSDFIAGFAETAGDNIQHGQIIGIKTDGEGSKGLLTLTLGLFFFIVAVDQRLGAGGVDILHG